MDFKNDNDEQCRIDFSKMVENTETKTCRIRRKQVDSILQDVNSFFYLKFQYPFFSRHGNLPINHVKKLNYNLHRQNIKMY